MSQCKAEHTCAATAPSVWYCQRGAGHANGHEVDESHRAAHSWQKPARWTTQKASNYKRGDQ